MNSLNHFVFSAEYEIPKIRIPNQAYDKRFFSLAQRIASLCFDMVLGKMDCVHFP